MKKHSTQLIAELLEANPSLKQDSAALEATIAELEGQKLEVEMDAGFARDLEARLVRALASEEAENVRTLARGEPRDAKGQSPWARFRGNQNLLNIFSMRSKMWGLAAAGALVVLIVPALYVQKQRGTTLAFNKPSIIRVAGSAFGPLTNAGAGGMGGGGNAAISERSFSEYAPATMQAPAEKGSGTSEPAKLIAPVTMYRLVYKGDSVTLSDKSVDVYKRVKPGSSKELAARINGVRIGGVDLGSFTQGGLTNFDITEDVDYGYIVNVNLAEGTININQNWLKWPNPWASGQEPRGLSEADMLEDAELIRIANEFVKSRGIDVSSYAEPMVDNQWRNIYYMQRDAALKSSEPAAKIMPIWWPEAITVTYPLKVDGKVVYESNGAKTGLQVTVSLRHKKVMSAGSITNQNYQVSGYEAETDAGRVVKIAEQGGVYGGGWYDPGAQVKELALGTPERVLVKTWQQNGVTSEEVIVPALLFPVVDAPQDYYQKSIVVPLAKQLLDANNGGGPITIMEGSPKMAQ